MSEDDKMQTRETMLREMERAHTYTENKKWFLANQSVIAQLRAGTHVCAPREPTEAMLHAAEAAYLDYDDESDPWTRAWSLMWAAMLAAATSEPQP